MLRASEEAFHNPSNVCRPDAVQSPTKKKKKTTAEHGTAMPASDMRIRSRRTQTIRIHNGAGWQRLLPRWACLIDRRRSRRSKSTNVKSRRRQCPGRKCEEHLREQADAGKDRAFCEYVRKRRSQALRHTASIGIGLGISSNSDGRANVLSRRRAR